MQQSILFGKYRVLGLLGKGGNSEVYLAEHIKLNSFRAIKFISKNHPLYDLQCKEALILKNLKHSCIPIIYDIEENEDGSYIVEQYLEGDTLRSHVISKGPLSEDLILRFGLQLCDLIGYLHSVHRPILYVDFKPENIILSEMTLKLIDFGSALYLDELSKHQRYFGTRGYAAPELYHDGTIDERCEVYGVGMIMYFMATGQDFVNQSGINHIDYIGRCSEKLKKVINECLKFHTSQRPTSIAGLSRELSAMVHKSQKSAKSSRTVTIAAAGAQQRIGVTHLALRLCKYIQSQGFESLYQERNDSGCIRSIRSYYEEIEIRQGIHIIEGIPMLSLEQQTPDTGNYSYIVLDYGMLSEMNTQEFIKADVKLIILGSKDWELDYSERVIRMTSEYKGITYLFNYIGGRQFQLALGSMGSKDCLRIPYEPDPFHCEYSKMEQDFFRKLIRIPEYDKKLIDRYKSCIGEDGYEAKADLINKANSNE